MGESARRYFMMNEEKSSAFMAEFNKAKEPRKLAYQSLVERYQADNLMVSRSNFSGERVRALLFKEKPEDRGGWKIERIPVDGESHWRVLPDRRFKLGKQLARDIDEANSVEAPSLFSPWAVEKLEMSALSFTAGAMHHAVAGFAQGKVVISVPVPNPAQEEFPETHPDLNEIKKSEFIALTEE